MSERHPRIVNAAERAWIDTAEPNRAGSPADRGKNAPARGPGGSRLHRVGGSPAYFDGEA